MANFWPFDKLKHKQSRYFGNVVLFELIGISGFSSIALSVALDLEAKGARLN
jgi:hypothetical protein